MEVRTLPLHAERNHRLVYNRATLLGRHLPIGKSSTVTNSTDSVLGWTVRVARPQEIAVQTVRHPILDRSAGGDQRLRRNLTTKNVRRCLGRVRSYEVVWTGRFQFK